jgi:GntR family transcriptional regulator
MQLHISSNDGIPIYLQIVHQVRYLVAARRLAPGEEIPPIRALAEQLVINPNTVAKAYHELEREGIVTKRHGSGTYVSDSGSRLARGERMKILTQRIDALLAEARHLDVSVDEVLDLVRKREANLQPKEKK